MARRPPVDYRWPSVRFVLTSPLPAQVIEGGPRQEEGSPHPQPAAAGAAPRRRRPRHGQEAQRQAQEQGEGGGGEGGRQGGQGAWPRLRQAQGEEGETPVGWGTNPIVIEIFGPCNHRGSFI